MTILIELKRVRILKNKVGRSITKEQYFKILKKMGTKIP